jgi:mycoredoxin
MRPARKQRAAFPSTPAWATIAAMNLLVYSAEWCRDCREAKRFLSQHSIPYTDINIETTPGAAEEIIAKTGKRGIPQFVLDGKWIQPYKPGQGFLHDEMAELFGIALP